MNFIEKLSLLFAILGSNAMVESDTGGVGLMFGLALLIGGIGFLFGDMFDQGEGSDSEQNSERVS